MTRPYVRVRNANVFAFKPGAREETVDSTCARGKALNIDVAILQGREPCAFFTELDRFLLYNLQHDRPALMQDDARSLYKCATMCHKTSQSLSA